MVTSPSGSTVIARLGDHYESLQPIGQPFGCHQLLANDRRGQRAVVIKSLAIEENTPAGDICCFEREIHLLETLNHPTIPTCLESYSIDTDEGKGLILIQSHRGGQTLAQHVAAGKIFNEAELKAIARQLLGGLVYLHSKGLVHRDIKPDNIAVSMRGDQVDQVSWLNLGTAQYIQAQRPDALVGTFGYMPPEQVGGQASYASDLYSLGATLIYLTTGHHLGNQPRQGHPVHFVCTRQRLSANFQQWINWLISPYIGDRPASAKAALRTLDRLPLAMLKQRIVNKPRRHQVIPVPIGGGQRSRYQPFFTRIKYRKTPQDFTLILPSAGLGSQQARQAVFPFLLGSALIITATYLLSLISIVPSMLTHSEGLASLAAVALGSVGIVYGLRFLKTASQLLNRALLRKIHIQIAKDVLLIGYLTPWQKSPTYVVNTERESIYNISALPDGSALRILTHHNRTHCSCVCYKLTLRDSDISSRDIRWITSLLNDWRAQL